VTPTRGYLAVPDAQGIAPNQVHRERHKNIVHVIDILSEDQRQFVTHRHKIAILQRNDHTTSTKARATK
jgi:hypothetical protein